MAKHRMVATVEWEIDLPDGSNITTIAKKTLESILPQNFDFKIRTIKTSKKPAIKAKKLGEFALDAVLNQLTSSEERVEFKIGKNSYRVKMNVDRYFVFKNSNVCVACGLEGTTFFLEHHPHNTAPHFNLYGRENKEWIFMTKDHIYARAAGGEDRHSNYQTMCAICNNLKGADYIPVDGVAQLRKIFNENKNVLTKKKLNLLLEETRNALKIARPVEPTDLDPAFIRLKSDVNIFRSDTGSLIAKTVYEKIPVDYVHLACMKRGTVIRPLKLDGKKLILPFNDLQFSLYQGFAE